MAFFALSEYRFAESSLLLAFVSLFFAAAALAADSLALFAEASALALLRFALASDWLADAFYSAAL